MGGYGFVHDADAETSNEFINEYKDSIGHGRALDCGAGIGRVTKYVLLNHFEKVDLVEPS